MKSSSGLLEVIRQRLDDRHVPLETTEQLLGLLGALVNSIDPHPKPDRELLVRLTDAFADHQDMIGLIQQQAAELDALKRITVRLTSSLELQKVLEAVVQEAMNLVRGASEAHIFLYQGQKVAFGASLNVNGSTAEQFKKPRPDELIEQVKNGRELIFIEDAGSDERFKQLSDYWAGSLIGIPLKMGERVLGVMILSRASGGVFTESELRLLGMLADQATIAILNARLHQAVSQQARSDVLTGLPNRRALDEKLDEEIKKSARNNCVFCVIMMDLDGFKQVNDTHGHDTGDEILRQVARSLQDNLRTSDFIARYGGDELTLVLPETDLNQAHVVVEKVQKNLASLALDLPDGTTIFMGVSGGIALYPHHAETAPELLRSADEALYRAKRSGGGIFLVAKKSNA